MPRTKPGTRANRSCASMDQLGPLPAPRSRPSSNASSLPVATIPRTVSNGSTPCSPLRDGVGVQFETLGGFLRAVPEPDALVAVDHDPQPVHRPLAETHIPSRPSSLRAVSITAGVISAMPRSLA